MRKFEFRLQKVLEYRLLVEGWAKDAYLEAQQKLLEAEKTLQTMGDRHQTALVLKPATIDEIVVNEAFLQRLEDEMDMQRSLIGILDSGVESARLTWLEKRREAETLQNMRDEAHAEYTLEVNRFEQAEADEWAVLRRKAA
ncbi:MAG: flagellar FliJ family protein [Chthonomonas sp.]|nr:flagellar FliJ family protein [Chthonomonas sp.]